MPPFFFLELGLYTKMHKHIMIYLFYLCIFPAHPYCCKKHSSKGPAICLRSLFSSKNSIIHGIYFRSIKQQGRSHNMYAPHSLSYQETSFIKLPVRAIPALASKIEVRGSPVKSVEQPHLRCSP